MTAAAPGQPAEGPEEDPWVEESTDAYGEQAAKTIRYRPEPATDPTDLIFEGPCPRCQHTFVYKWPLEVVRGLGDETGDVVTVSCQCPVLHPGRPEKADGCGAYWNVTAPWPHP